jgi:hypothetical protein
MQTYIDCRFPDATWLALTNRAATVLTAICGPAPGGRKLLFLTVGCKRGGRK